MTVETLEKLAEKAAQGDRDALRGLHNALGSDLLGYLADLVGDVERAEDLLQHVWLKTMEKLPTRKSPVRPWLFRMARNLVIDEARSQKVREQHKLRIRQSQRVETDSPADDEAKHAIRAAVGRLRFELREVVVLRYYSGMTFEEMSTVLDCPLGTVSTRLRRGLAILREELGDESAA